MILKKRPQQYLAAPKNRSWMWRKEGRFYTLPLTLLSRRSLESGSTMAIVKLKTLCFKEM